ncbi:MAG: type II toxin-antitoxin system PemK/MazF family toxin [Dyadobacter sp.]|uniref:type II toxin-antitoxin system PemK/MazF family toxin n=1 Tax=Dyadobacter sp. TaxID=1914288 RepID=UPI001B117FFE|nr:type II toxin-antitoxin system PemK/MazF family toxin [Dyadobacter sp.]
MPFNPGDIVSLDFLIPSTGKYLTHSAVILSTVDVYNHERTYVCAMMSSYNVNDRFTFKLENSMLQNASNKECSQVRSHLITYVPDTKVRPANGTPYNRLSQHAFERLISHIDEVVFGV